MTVTPPTGPDYVFFGDSLSDNGNLYALGEGVIDEQTRQSIGGFEGRISDGPVAVEYAADLLGATMPENYAFASARAAGTFTLGELVESAGYSDALIVPPDDPVLDFDINLGAQIDRFQADHAGDDLSGTTALILIGGNDYQTIDLTQLDGLIAEALDVLVAASTQTLLAAAELSRAGVGSVVICTLPTATFFAGVAAEPVLLQTVIETVFTLHNVILTAGANALSQRGMEVEVLDLTPISAAITEDPSAFGLIAPYTETLTEGDPAVIAGYDPDQIAFWDEIHMTTATHGIVGAYMAHALTGEVTVLDDESNVSLADTGADLVLAYGGNDIAAAGSGDDVGFGGTGHDLLLGGGGNDLLSGGSGRDRLEGGRGDDVLGGNEGGDRLNGRGGNDVLIDGNGHDLAFGGWGDDTFIFTEAALVGGSGVYGDAICGGAGMDTLYLVLDSATAAAVGGDTDAALAAMGILTAGIEQVVLLDGRAALDTLAGEDWYETADLWGLV